MSSVSTFWHGVNVDRPREVTPVARVCAMLRIRGTTSMTGYMFQTDTTDLIHRKVRDYRNKADSGKVNIVTDTSADDSSLIRQYLVHSAHTSGRCVRGVWIGGVTLIICELSAQLSRGDTCETSRRIKSTRVTYTYVIGIS